MGQPCRVAEKATHAQRELIIEGRFKLVSSTAITLGHPFDWGSWHASSVWNFSIPTLPLGAPAGSPGLCDQEGGVAIVPKCPKRRRLKHQACKHAAQTTQQTQRIR